MKIELIIEELEQIQSRLLAEGSITKLRPNCRPERLEALRAALVIGARGVGKTTLLLESCRNQKILYMSADHPLLGQVGLWDLASTAFQLGYEGIAVDEVHFLANWSQDLKAIYDSYPNKKIWASDSSSIILRKGIADLSRRFPKVTVPLLSLREYVYMCEDKELDYLNALASSPESYQKILQEVPISALFRDYLSFGFRPFFVEGNYKSKILNIIEKTIFTDVPFFLPQVQDQYLRLMNAIIGYLASSAIPTINVQTLATEWSIGKEKLYELLSVLEHLGLINIVRHKNDQKASGKGAKIFLADPSMYSVLAGKKGNIREAFVVAVAKQSNKAIYAAKDEREYDFLIDNTSVEIGGKTKKRKNADLIIRDDIERPGTHSIPLWSLGFWY